AGHFPRRSRRSLRRCSSRPWASPNFAIAWRRRASAPAEPRPMPEWLTKSFSVDQELAPEQMLLRLLLAACYGGCVALTYVLSHGRNKPDAVTLKTTLVLLSILIAMVSMV